MHGVYLYVYLLFLYYIYVISTTYIFGLLHFFNFHSILGYFLGADGTNPE